MGDRGIGQSGIDRPWIEDQGRVAATKELTGGVRRFLISFVT